MYAQGTNCSTATVIPGKGTYADFSFQPKLNVAWFSITAASARMQIEIMRPVLAQDTPFVHVDSLILYAGTCNGLKALKYSTSHDDTVLSDSLPGLQALNLTPGQTYYIKVTRTVKPGDESARFFGLNQSNMPDAVLQSCTQSLCGPNLLCNGDFEISPSWATPTGTPVRYNDASYTFPQTPVASPQTGYCISSPNMRYNGNNFGGSLAACGEPWNDFTDIYCIGKNMFGNTAHSGSWFMAVDCPSDYCYDCSSAPSHYCAAPTLNTPGYTCIPWSETVPVVAGQQYVFDGWIKSIDVAGSNAAIVSISVNGGAPLFQDVIDPSTTYANWTHICFNWTAPTGTTSAQIQVFGKGGSNSSGYDFGLDEFSFGTTAIPITINSPTICSGSSATLTVTPATAGASYSWSTGVTTTTNSISVSPAATTTYSVTVTVGKCQSTATTTVTVSHLIVSTTSTPTCINACDGTATATVTGGTAPYTYSWAPGGQTTASASGLCGGTHTVTVTDASGCTSTASVHVLSVGPPIVHASSTTICGSGSATICASGTATSYTWSTSPIATTTCITENVTTTTTYTVTGSNGACTTTATGTITVDPLPVICLPSSTEICPGSCVTLDAVCIKRPQAGITYTWAPATGLSATTGGLVTACPTVSTTYTVTATNTVTGCHATATEVVNIYPAPTIVMSSTQTCVGTCVGTATATVTGAAAPYTYSWSNGQTTSTATGLCAGNYSVTITDANGCKHTATIRIFAEVPVAIHATSASICEGASATICATSVFGTPSVIWSNGATTNCITVSPTSTTTYTVTSTGGLCSSVATGTVTVNPLPVLCLTDTIKLCPSSCATLDGLCGKPHAGVIYNWLPTTGLTGNTHSYIVTACPTVTTTYTLTATNTATGCSAAATVVVEVYPHATITMSATATCSGSCVGTATATVTGGSAPYTYAWSNGQTTSTATGLCAGNYSVSVTDANGCKSTGTVFIFAQIPVAIHATSASICEGASATICATGTFGTPPVIWSNGATTPCITVTPTTTTTYSVTTTSGLCHSVATGTVTVNPLPALCLTDTIKLCPSSCATLNGLCQKPQPGVIYNWLPTTGLTGNTHSYIVTACPTVTTTYTLTATNTITGCSTAATVVVVVYPHATVTMSATSSCLNQCNGTATATVSGGSAPYSYSWAPGGQTTSTATGLCAGTYTVNITDAHGCKSTGTVHVFVQDIGAIHVTSDTICAGSSGTICASGGVGVSSFSWSNGSTTPCITVSPATTTTYSVSAVQGACTMVATGTVTVAPSPVVTATATPTCSKLCTGTATATTTGGIAPYTYSWAPGGQTSSSLTGLCGGNYTVTVTDAHGCTGKVVVNVPYVFPPSISVSSDSICAGGSATICASGSAITYVWSTGATTSCITVSPTVTTTYTVTGSNGVNGSCSATATGTVTVIPHLTGTITSTPTCGKLCTGTATATPASGVAPYTYSWAPGGQTTATATALCGGNYTVTVTDAHGCTGHASVNVPYVFPPTLAVSSATICAGSSATICASGTATTFTWNPTGATTSCITVSPTVTTTYTVTGGDSASGACVATATGTVTVNPIPAVCTTDSVLVCIDHCTPLHALCNGNVLPNVTYVWSPSPTISSGVDSSSAVACPTTHTIYTVTATNTVTGCTATGTTSAFMFPFSNFAIHGPASVVCGSTNTYTITPNLPSPPVNYTWTAPTATPSSGTGPTATVTFNSPGSIDWIVSYPGTGIGGGCQRDISLFVTCGPTAKPRDGMENATTTDNNVVVYPNPAGEIVNVQMVLQPNEQLNMCMYNNLGEQIKCETLTENISHISTSMLPAGIYFYRIINTDGTLIKSDKIMIVH